MDAYIFAAATGKQKGPACDLRPLSEFRKPEVERFRDEIARIRDCPFSGACFVREMEADFCPTFAKIAAFVSILSSDPFGDPPGRPLHSSSASRTGASSPEA